MFAMSCNYKGCYLKTCPPSKNIEWIAACNAWQKKLTIYANIAYMQTIFTMGKLHVYNPHHETVTDQKSDCFEWHDCMCKQRNKPIWFNTNKITMSTDVNIYHRYQFFVISTRLIWMYVFISTFCLAQHRWLSHSCTRYCLINQLPQ